MSQTADKAPRVWPRIALSIVHIGLGLSGIGFGLPYVVAAFSVEAGENPGVFGFGVYLFAPILTIYCLPSLICGAALLFDRDWAASILRVQAFAYALAIPIGTLLAIATWMALAPAAGRGRPEQADAFGLSANRTRSDFLFVLIAVASGFALLLKGLFTFHDSPSPSEIDAAFPIAAIMFIVCGVYFAPRLTARFRSWRRKPSTPTQHPDGSAAPSGATICEHLGPVLRAMRRSGVVYRSSDARWVEAECRFDVAELEKQFRIADPLVLGAVPPDERHVRETVDVLYCREHEIAVRAVYSRQSDERAPVFPTRA